MSLKRLIQDGRIHPARIEETVSKVRKEISKTIREAGKQAAYEVGIHGIHDEIINMMGRLNYRTSYSQNVLRHSVEVSNISGMIASELGANIKIAKRAGLLHDIGKAMDQEIEGPHAVIGAEFCRKHGESQEIVHAIGAHHFDWEPNTLEAIIVLTADALSAARPGARREVIQNYINRMENLEAIANQFDGVEKSYAIQAGRELRIIVEPKNVSDDEMQLIAREIATKIETEMDYPGEIKVTLIRETRTVDFAR
jgi:ribonuclease Y